MSSSEKLSKRNKTDEDNANKSVDNKKNVETIDWEKQKNGPYMFGKYLNEVKAVQAPSPPSDSFAVYAQMWKVSPNPIQTSSSSVQMLSGPIQPISGPIQTTPIPVVDLTLDDPIVVDSTIDEIVLDDDLVVDDTEPIEVVENVPSLVDETNPNKTAEIISVDGVPTNESTVSEVSTNEIGVSEFPTNESTDSDDQQTMSESSETVDSPVVYAAKDTLQKALCKPKGKKCTIVTLYDHKVHIEELDTAHPFQTMKRNGKWLVIPKSGRYMTNFGIGTWVTEYDFEGGAEEVIYRISNIKEPSIATPWGTLSDTERSFYKLLKKKYPGNPKIQDIWNRFKLIIMIEQDGFQKWLRKNHEKQFNEARIIRAKINAKFESKETDAVNILVGMRN